MLNTTLKEKSESLTEKMTGHPHLWISLWSDFKGQRQWSLNIIQKKCFLPNSLLKGFITNYEICTKKAM